jgi:hypothetical protein
MRRTATKESNSRSPKAVRRRADALSASIASGRSAGKPPRADLLPLVRRELGRVRLDRRPELESTLDAVETRSDCGQHRQVGVRRTVDDLELHVRRRPARRPRSGDQAE